MQDFPGGTEVGNLPHCSRSKRCSFDPWVRKIPWRRHGNPLQYSCLENPMDRGAWQATVPGLTESNTTEWLTLALPGLLLMTGTLLYSRFPELIRGFWDGSVVKNLPAMLETSIGGAGWLQYMGLQRIEHDRVTKTLWVTQLFRINEVSPDSLPESILWPWDMVGPRGTGQGCEEINTSGITLN